MVIGQKNISAQSLGFVIDEKHTQAKIPFTYLNNFIIIELMFNEVIPLKFIFDTGAENTLFTKKGVIDLFDYEYGRKFTVIGSDLKTPLTAYLVQNVHLSIVNAKAAHQDVLVLEEDYIDFEKFLGMEIHGIAAADLFKRYVVKIDYQKKELVLYRKLPKIKGHYHKLDVSIEKSKPYVKMPVQIMSQKSLEAKLLIDTGADMGLLINIKSDSSLSLPNNSLPSNLGIGLGGFLKGYIGRIHSLNFGPYVFNDMISNFQDDVNSTADSLNVLTRNGIIGNRILKKFTLILDYIHGDLYIKPHKKWDEPLEVDRSGLSLILSGKNKNDLVVQYVIPSSPAEEVGLKKGDKITVINGIPSYFFSFEGLLNKFSKKTGKKVNISVMRNGEKLKKTIVLRDIL